MSKKHEGWINIYFDMEDERWWVSDPYRSPEEADQMVIKDFKYSRFIATKHIEWEEEE